MVNKKERNHYDFKEIEIYCGITFPKRLAVKGEKANFRRTAKQFSIKNGQLYYKESRTIIADKDRHVNVIYDIDEGSGETSHSKAMSAHLGRTKDTKNCCTFLLIWDLFPDYIQKCDRC